MKGARRPQPTGRELDILHVLWGLGPATVRQVRDALGAGGLELAYTTVLTLLQIMTEKGLTTRDESVRSHVYSARFSKAEIESAVVGDLVEKLFGGSGLALAAKAVEVSMSRTDRTRLKALLDELEGGNG